MYWRWSACYNLWHLKIVAGRWPLWCSCHFFGLYKQTWRVATSKRAEWIWVSWERILETRVECFLKKCCFSNALDVSVHVGKIRGLDNPKLGINSGKSYFGDEEASGILQSIYFTFTFFCMHVQEWYVIKVYI